MPGSGLYEAAKADYQLSRDIYLSIQEEYSDGVYVEAARLYAAVCLARIGVTDQARSELLTFVRDDPEGLYRGEALKLISDLYLESDWNAASARKTYEKANQWCETMRTRGRIVETYTVPEASQRATRPPKKYRTINAVGIIEEEAIKAHALVNRLTADWYLSKLQTQINFRLGFLQAAEGDWNGAFLYFDRTLQLDSILQKAETGNFYNSYDRLKRSQNQKAFIATPEEMRGLQGKAKLAMQWADMQFLMAHFAPARSLYQRLQAGAEKHRDRNVLTRAALAEALLLSTSQNAQAQETALLLHEIVLQHSRTPSSPYLWLMAGLNGRYLRGEDASFSPIACLQKVYQSYPAHHLAPRARYYEILHSLAGTEHEKRQLLIDDFRKAHPESPYLQHILQYDKAAREFFTVSNEELK